LGTATFSGANSDMKQWTDLAWKLYEIDAPRFRTLDWDYLRVPDTPTRVATIHIRVRQGDDDIHGRAKCGFSRPASVSANIGRKRTNFPIRREHPHKVIALRMPPFRVPERYRSRVPTWSRAGYVARQASCGNKNNATDGIGFTDTTLIFTYDAGHLVSSIF